MLFKCNHIYQGYDTVLHLSVYVSGVYMLGV